MLPFTGEQARITGIERSGILGQDEAVFGVRDAPGVIGDAKQQESGRRQAQEN